MRREHAPCAHLTCIPLNGGSGGARLRRQAPSWRRGSRCAARRRPSSATGSTCAAHPLLVALQQDGKVLVDYLRVRHNTALALPLPLLALTARQINGSSARETKAPVALHHTSVVLLRQAGAGAGGEAGPLRGRQPPAAARGRGPRILDLQREEGAPRVLALDRVRDKLSIKRAHAQRVREDKLVTRGRCEQAEERASCGTCARPAPQA